MSDVTKHWCNFQKLLTVVHNIFYIYKNLFELFWILFHLLYFILQVLTTNSWRYEYYVLNYHLIASSDGNCVVYFLVNFGLSHKSPYLCLLFWHFVRTKKKKRHSGASVTPERDASHKRFDVVQILTFIFFSFLKMYLSMQPTLLFEKLRVSLSLYHHRPTI